MIRVGTSGFSYRHWRGHLYPEKLPVRAWLERYADFFGTVELNATFYRLPRPEVVDRWRTESPPDFLFACKGSRFLTHLKRLTEVDQGLERFFSLVRRLRGKLGPVLWQLPPQMNEPDARRLENFLSRLPTGVRHVFEFRSAAWYTREICDLLDEYGAAFCEHDLVDRHPPRITGGFRYLRFHGATAPYRGRYGAAALRPLARSLARSARRGIDAFVYFNNDTHGHAIYDALMLRELLGERNAPRLIAPASPSHPSL
jgi:uncharacterized protein YecE (DUF72 family)